MNSISCVWPKGSAFIGYWWHWEGEGNMGLWEMDMFHIPPRMNPDVEKDEKAVKKEFIESVTEEDTADQSGPTNTVVRTVVRVRRKKQTLC